MARRWKLDGRIAIAISGILYGGVTVDGSILAKNGLSTLDISFFFLAISLIPLAPFVLRHGAKEMALKFVASYKFLGAYALVNAFILLSQFGALSLGLGPAIVAFLLYTQPVWTVIFGRVIFKEKIDHAKIVVIVLALLGIFLITNPVLPVSSGNPLAEALALLGGVFLALWIILGKKGRSVGSLFNDPAELTFAVRSSSLIPIGAISFLSLLGGKNHYYFLGNLNALYSNLPLLVVFAIFAGTVPDFLFYLGVDKVKSLEAGVILLLEPISATVLSALLHISSLGALQLAGGGLILFANYLATRSFGKTKEDFPQKSPDWRKGPR